MKSSGYNYRAFSPSKNIDCGHSHHSIASASQCAEHLGWSDAVIKKVHRANFKRDSLPDYLQNTFDETDSYEMLVKVRFVADNPNAVADISVKIENILRSSVKSVVHVETANVKRVL